MRAGSDRGSAAVDFVLVAPLVLVLGLAVAQLALALHVRSTLASAAAEGARRAALAGATPADGRARLDRLLEGTLADGVVETVGVRAARERGLDVVRVDVQARLPLVGLLGPAVLEVHGHALREPS